MFQDVTSAALHSALSGLSLRQRTTADNIANIQTPGFLAGRVDFEDALRDAVSTGSSPDVTGSVARSLEPTREDGNNVNLDEETLAATRDQLHYQLMTTAMSDQFAILRTSMRTS